MEKLTITWKRGDPFLYLWLNEAEAEAHDPAKALLSLPCYNIVRNRNFTNPRDERALHLKKEVVSTSPVGKAKAFPYMPQLFPLGRWLISDIMRHPIEDAYLHPYFLVTNAKQKVKVWATDAGGGYDHETDVEVWDTAYGAHGSSSRTTLGCLRIGEVNDTGPNSPIEKLVAKIQPTISRKETVNLWITE